MKSPSSKQATIAALVYASLFGLAAGCSTGAPAPEEAPPVEASVDAPASGPAAALSATSDKEDNAPSPLLAKTGETTTVTYLGWGGDGTLQVGFVDSAVVLVNDRQGRFLDLRDEPWPVISVSPTADLVMLRSEPRMLVRTSDNKEVLRMNDLGPVERALFTADGTIFFAAELEGKLHIWRNGQDLPQLPDETLQDFLDRQTPDYTAHLTPLDGPLVVTTGRQIAWGDAEGKVGWWDPRDPETIQYLARFRAPLKTLQAGDGYLVGTSKEGQLGVLSIEPPGFRRWSARATADHAAVSPEWPNRLVVLEGRELSVLDANDGQKLWTTEIADGDVCGLVPSRTGEKIALCLDNAIFVFDGADGSLDKAFYRGRADSIDWID